MKNAPFIVLDGLDGSGKGTQVRLLREWLHRSGIPMHFTREPGGAEFSEDIRKVIKSSRGEDADTTTIFLLFFAARNEWMKKDVAPALNKGVPVFTDRGDSSTYAYQVCAEEHHELAELFFVMREQVFGETKPSCYIMLEVPPEVARDRALADKSRDTSYFDEKPLEYYERVARGFRDFGTAINSQKIRDKVFFVDGMRDPAVVHEDIWRIVLNEMGVDV